MHWQTRARLTEVKAGTRLTNLHASRCSRFERSIDLLTIDMVRYVFSTAMFDISDLRQRSTGPRTAVSRDSGQQP